MRLKISYIILLVGSIIQIPELFARHGGGGRGHGHGGHAAHRGGRGGRGHGGHAHRGYGRHGYGRRGYGGYGRYGYGGYGYGLGLAGLGLGLGYGLGYGYGPGYSTYNTPVVEEVVSTYPQQTIIEQEPLAIDTEQETTVEQPEEIEQATDKEVEVA